LAGEPFEIIIVPSTIVVRELVVERALLDAAVKTSLVKREFVQRHNIALDDQYEDIVRDSVGNEYCTRGHFDGNWRFPGGFVGHPPTFAVVLNPDTVFPQDAEVLLTKKSLAAGERGVYERRRAEG
jgi:hypothetical protein